MTLYAWIKGMSCRTTSWYGDLAANVFFTVSLAIATKKNAHEIAISNGDIEPLSREQMWTLHTGS